VHCPPREVLLNPDRFIRDHALTVWFSVPSVGLLMQRLGALKGDRYPSLRWSLFCGEPLSVTLAEAWSKAAPASTLENLYGPTELTVACTVYRWDRVRSQAESRDGIVPIGKPLGGMRQKIVDETLREVIAGEPGELVMSGPQRTSGYWRDAEATARAHVSITGDADTYYRTGDRVRRAADGGPLTYIGRVDHQIKILGHRVELGEVESVLRAEPGVDAAVAVGWPVTQTGPGGIAAFVTGRGLDPVAIRLRVQAKLQSHAVPQTIQVLSAFPQNASGKVDRDALLRLLSA
jgi:acyl-coenzyme A synthetase/AMP-(fatty) acid ligase